MMAWLRYCGKRPDGTATAWDPSLGSGSVPDGGSSAAHAPRRLAASRGSQAPVSWQEVDGLINAPARVHGRQRKAGLPAGFRSAMAHMVNMDPFGPIGALHNESRRLAAWLDTAARWEAGELRGLPSAALRSPLPSCHYLVDRTRKVIFVRTTKIGGTTLTNSLGLKNHPIACQQGGPAVCDKRCQGRPMCLEYLTDPDEVQRIWQDYTVFSFARNPWSRAISSYRYNNKRAIEPECHAPFTSFAAAPPLAGALCYRKYGSCCKERYGFVLEHIEAQTPSCLFTEDGQPAVDFLGRSERFDDDFQDLIELLNSRRPEGLPPLNITSVLKLNSIEAQSSYSLVESSDSAEEAKRKSYAEMYMGNSALCDIRTYFDDDFRLLGFPTARL